MSLGQRAPKVSDSNEKARVLWITNLAAPYRLPVWKSLADSYALDVALLIQAKNFSRDARDRGEEWLPTNQSANGYSVDTLTTFRFPKISRSLHFIYSLRDIRRFPRKGVVLLSGWEEPAYWQALVLAKLRGSRVVGFYESVAQSHAYSGGPVASARRLFFSLLDGVVVPGPASGMAIQNMGVKQSKIYEGFNAVDVALFADARRRSQRVVAEKGHRFVYVGRLISIKNVGNIIEAFSKVRSDDDSLTIIGSGDEQTDLQHQVQSLKLSDQVSFVGHVPYADLPGVMVNFDTLVLASSIEPWGLVVNEALAAGLHAVVSEACGVAASVEGMRGVYVSGVDLESLARAMAESARDWEGPIMDPEILLQTPESFASVFSGAFSSHRD